MGIFSGLWVKLTGILALLVGVLLLRGKYQAGKIDKLEDENSKIKKKSEIQSQAAVDRARIISQEQEAVLQLTKEARKHGKEITTDDINQL